MMMPDHTNVHLLGMWFSFGFSALLITWFVTRMAVTIKQRDAELASMREQRLRDEQLLGIATLAASTVHELGTPLSTLGMVVDEMKADADGSGNKPAELATLETEIQRCRRIVQNLSTAAAQHQPDVMQQRILRDYLGDVLTHWQLLQPAIALYQNLEHAQGQVMVDATLEPALLNILNNAAEASPSGIEVACENATAQQVIISVRDYGAGFKLPAENLMQPFASTRGEGRGLGLYLTKATIERLGGKLVLSNHPQGGGLVRIYLPTRKL